MRKTTRRELSAATRGFLIGAVQAGQSPNEVGALKNIEPDTVRWTVRNADNLPQLQSRQRLGTPKKLSDRDERRLLRYVRANPKAMWKTTQRELDLPCSKSTYQRALRDHYITKWRAAKRPELSEDITAQRLQWARDHLYW
jgi:hypothetical protein